MGEPHPVRLLTLYRAEWERSAKSVAPRRSLESAIGKKAEWQSHVDHASFFVDAILDDEGRIGSNVFREPKVAQVAKGLAEIERNPMKSLVDVAKRLCNFADSVHRGRPREQDSRLLAAPFRVNDPVGRCAA